MYALFVLKDRWEFREIVFTMEEVNTFEDTMLARISDEGSEVQGYTYFKLPD